MQGHFPLHLGRLVGMEGARELPLEKLRQQVDWPCHVTSLLPHTQRYLQDSTTIHIAVMQY